jgi:hypothetical protein
LRKNSNGAATDETSLVLSGGFSLYDSADQSLDAALPIVSVSQANPAVFTVNAHGYAAGDIVRVYGTTGMQQIGGMDFQVASVPNANTFTVNLNSSGFAAPASGGFVRRLRSSPIYVPQRRFIVSITQAQNAVVSTSVAHGLVDGQYVRLHVPSAFGMFQMQNRLAQASVINDFQFSVNVDSQAFSPFAFPASADVPFVFAEMVPVGSFGIGSIDTGSNSRRFVTPGSTRNDGFMGMHIGAAVAGALGDRILWRAVSSDQFFV